MIKKNNYLKRVAPIIVGVAVIIAIGISVKMMSKVSEKSETIKTQETQETKSPSFVTITEEDFVKDMSTHYEYLSSKNKTIIVKTIIAEANAYNINPLILYSILYTESSFKHWIEHSLVTVTINKVPSKIRAVGLGGVVWEWWGDKIKAAGIAETRSDLFDIETNIKATAFVYNEMFKLPLHSSARSQDESALLRYFGGNFPEYFKKIDSKIAEFVKPNLYR